MVTTAIDREMLESYPYLDNVLTSKEKRKLQRRNRKIKNPNNIQSFGHGVKRISPKSEKQSQLISSIYHTTQTITIGSAGTGKTYVTAYIAAHMFLEKEIDKIIITRPNVATGRSIGFFPGSLEEKMAPWMSPITNVFKEVLGNNLYELALKRKDIEIVPFEVIRGWTFKDAFVILDEAQNTTVSEIKAFLTRIGEDSKVVINGDVAQTDLEEQSGLAYIIRILNKSATLSQKVSLVEFTSQDIVRSDICKDWVIEFERS